jgi:2-methylcitrate dehydratase PrpD
MATLTDRVVEVATGTRGVSAEAAHAVGRAMLDFAACAVAGSVSPETAPVLAFARSQPAGEATVIGTSLRTDVITAALVNGAVGHALDYDDFTPFMFHPSVVLVPPLLALGQRDKVSGADAVAAYVAGFEVGARLARVLNPGHYELGWHSTSTIGTIAATVAAARIRGLRPAALRHALGVAASSAGGLRRNFGSTVKPLHAGLAAMHATLAVELAAAGIEADTDALAGFVDVFTGGAVSPRELADSLLDGPPELVTHGIAMKPYACCGALTTAIEAILLLVAEHSIEARDVARIGCVVRPLTRDIARHRVARTPAEGRFSIEYSLAVALLDGTVGIAQYDAARVADPLVQELSGRVEVGTEPLAGSATSPAVVSITTRAGTTVTARVDTPLGKAERAISTLDLVTKFRHSTANVFSAARQDAVTEFALSLSTVPNVGVLASELAA